MTSSGCVSCRIFSCKTHSTPSTQSASSQQCAEMHHHREIILETLVESEQYYISEFEDFIGRTVHPLVLTLSTLTSTHFHFDVHELMKFHRHLSHVLRDSIKTEHRVGGIFLQLSSTFKPIFEAYCYQHAKTLFLLNHNKNRILKALSKIDPFIDCNKAYGQLIKNLSLPIDRLEKYVSLLNEYLYNLEESHIDRTDTQQAVEYYAQLVCFGAEWRKRKEWELNIVHNTIHEIASETPSSSPEIKSNTEYLQVQSSTTTLKNPVWSKGCLRPHSPSRPRQQNSIGLHSSTITGRNSPFMSMKKFKANEFLKRVETSEGDSLLLSVIEAYCVLASHSDTPKSKMHGTVDQSNILFSPTTSIDVERRAMYNMINELRLTFKSLEQEFKEEKRARKQLDSQIQRLLILTYRK